MNTSILAAKATLAATHMYQVAAKAGQGGTVIGGDNSDLATLFNNIYKTITTYVTYIGMIALAACGLVYLISSDQQSAAQAKKWALRIFIGLAIVLLASVIVNGFADALSGTRAG